MTELHTEIYLRADTVLVTKPRHGRQRVLAHPSRIAERLVVIVLDGEDGGSRPWTWGAYRVLARQSDGTYALALPLDPAVPSQGIVAGVTVPREERAAGEKAMAHRAVPVLDTQEFVHAWLVESYTGGSATVAFDLPVILGSLATWCGRGKRANREAWALTFCPLRPGERTRTGRKTRRGKISHNPSAHPHCPGVRILPGRPPIAFPSFTKPRGEFRRTPHHPGRWLSLREQGYVLTAADHSFENLGRAFGVAVPASAASDASIEERFTALTARLDATCRLAEAILHELQRHPVLTDENEMARRQSEGRRAGLLSLHSPASLLRAYKRAAGITEPPRLDVASGVNMTASEIRGAAAAAFHAPRSETLTRLQPRYGVMLDVRSCFPASALLQGVSGWWSAERIIVEEIPPDDVRAELAQATPETYLDPAAWADLTNLYLIQPAGDWLPSTIAIRKKNRIEYESVWGPLTIPASLGPVWVTKAHALLSRFRTGRVPTILKALRFRPGDLRKDLTPVVFRSEVPLGEDFARGLIQARYHLEAQRLTHLAGAVKVMANAEVYGIAAELRRKAGRAIRVRDGVREYLAEPEFCEEPGPYTFWPIAAFTVAGSWLLVELVEHLARRAGGAVEMVLTDCALATSANGRPPEEIARDVIVGLEPLTPLPGLLRPLAKPQDGTAKHPEATWCFSVATPAYCRYHKEPSGHKGRLVKASGFALSMLLDPHTRRVNRTGEGVPAWWDEAWTFMLGHSRPGRRPASPDWIDRPAMQTQSYRSPAQAPEFRRLRYPDGSPARPFATVYLRRYYDEIGRIRDEFFLGALPRDECTPHGGLGFVTYRHVLVRHAERPELKMVNGWDRGPLQRYAIYATGIRHIGRETPPLLGQEHAAGAPSEPGHVKVYQRIPTPTEVKAACDTLRGYPRALVAQLLGIGRPWLSEVLCSAACSNHLGERIVTVAETIRAHGGRLRAVSTDSPKRPKDDSTQRALRSLRDRGHSVPEIARLTGVSERTVWRWLAHQSCPHERTLTRLGELADIPQEAAR